MKNVSMLTFLETDSAHQYSIKTLFLGWHSLKNTKQSRSQNTRVFPKVDHSGIDVRIVLELVIIYLTNIWPIIQINKRPNIFSYKRTNIC